MPPLPLLLLPLALAAAAHASAPYSLPVVPPPPVRSPPTDARAPFTPTVLRLLEQLLPAGATGAKLDEALRLLTGGKDPACAAAGTNGAPRGTTPSISPLCWADGQGVNWLGAPGQTTAPMQLLGLAATFDRAYANAWGQVEGREGRQLGVTGLLGPQADVNAFVNWRRGVNSSSGEDPFLGAELAVAQIHGIQGAGLMAQLKHLGPYAGTDERQPVTVSDQAMHELVLPPFEAGVKEAGVAALMASYQLFRVESADPARGTPLPVAGGAPAPATGAPLATWPLDEAHFSAEQPWLLVHVLRRLWGATAVAAPDYGGVHSTSALVQGLDMEPFADYFGRKDPSGPDPTGSTCADAGGRPVDCAAPGALHVAGIPSPECRPWGCGLARAVEHGALPLEALRAPLARMLYQEERFGLLGRGDRPAGARLPLGPTSGPVQLGTKHGDAAVAELGAERGAVLLENDGAALPITAADLERGISVAGPGAEHLVAAPFDESATGFPDRVAVGPLAQLGALSGRPGAFTYSPVGDATGRPVPASALSTSAAEVTGALARREDGGAEAADAGLDFTAASGRGLLPAGTYTWRGFLHVARDDAYTFRFQHGEGARVTFTLDGEERTVQEAIPFYRGHYYGARTVPVARTVDGYTEGGLANEECHAGPPPRVFEPSGIGFQQPPAPAHPCPPRLAPGPHALTIRLEADRPAAFRFAWSRAQGDLDDAAADARGKALALVFVHDDQVEVVSNQGGPGWVSSPRTQVARLPPAQEALIEAVAAANPRTVVVLNTGLPVIVPWIDRVRGALEMWNAGQEGGTATARLLLGQASPGGRTPVTWPLHGADTVYGYLEPEGGLYPGASGGAHPERLNGLAGGGSAWTQGIYVGYRYYDQLGIPVRFPFGHGLTYTTFAYEGLALARDGDGASVTFTVRNTGRVAAAAVPQVYVGPAPEAPPGVQQAVRALRGFERVELRPGEARRVTIHLDARSFQHWSSPEQAFRTLPGARRIWVGEGLGDLRLSGTLAIGG